MAGAKNLRKINPLTAVYCTTSSLSAGERREEKREEKREEEEEEEEKEDGEGSPT